MPSTPLAPRVAALYEQAPARQRLGLLNVLLRPVGPLALVSIAAGAFAPLLPPTRWHEVSATISDTQRITPVQVLALAQYVEQKSPEALAQLPDLAADA